MTTGYRCGRCGHEHIIDDGKQENTIRIKKTCRKCNKIKRLKSKANRRGKPKDYYLNQKIMEK